MSLLELTWDSLSRSGAFVEVYSVFDSDTFELVRPTHISELCLQGHTVTPKGKWGGQVILDRRFVKRIAFSGVELHKDLRPSDAPFQAIPKYGSMLEALIWANDQRCSVKVFDT